MGLSHLFLHPRIRSTSSAYKELWINAGNRPWSRHDLHPQNTDILVRGCSRNKHGVHPGGKRDSNLCWCVWVGGLTEDFTKETDSALTIIKAEKLRQAPTEAHTCYKCTDIKTIWSAQDDYLSKGTSADHPHDRGVWEMEGRLGCDRGIYRIRHGTKWRLCKPFPNYRDQSCKRSRQSRSSISDHFYF